MAQKNKLSTGTVLWFNNNRGYGWIEVDDEEEDAYVHFSDIIGKGFRTLSDGQKVEFKLIYQQDGDLKAVQVTGPDGEEIRNDKKRNDDEYDDDEYDDDEKDNNYYRPRRGRGGRGRGRGGYRGRGRGYGGRGRGGYRGRGRGGYRGRGRGRGRGGGYRGGRGRGGGYGGNRRKGEVMRGTVLSFRGNFGWISCNDGSGDAYVHYSEIHGKGFRELRPGQIVEFILERQFGGRLKAREVTGPNRTMLDDKGPYGDDQYE